MKTCFSRVVSCITHYYCLIFTIYLRCVLWTREPRERVCAWACPFYRSSVYVVPATMNLMCTTIKTHLTHSPMLPTARIPNEKNCICQGTATHIAIYFFLVSALNPLRVTVILSHRKSKCAKMNAVEYNRKNKNSNVFSIRILCK